MKRIGDLKKYATTLNLVNSNRSGFQKQKVKFLAFNSRWSPPTATEARLEEEGTTTRRQQRLEEEEGTMMFTNKRRTASIWC
ncbi:hypothetical protein PIB30_052040 [Stylosanthes scabra]|uniref:Uncharacterized protein n=1 Tax=Stylosanthes scabra TaxID=79078 RepID=A0ABU6SID1_9FABA|nr:hypothetical protein [Stylosanthes scabra]